MAGTLRVPELPVDHQHGLGAPGAEVRDGERTRPPRNPDGEQGLEIEG